MSLELLRQRRSIRQYQDRLVEEEKIEQQVEAIIAIGYPKEEKAGHPLASLPYDKVSYNRYGEKK
jgi:nitroreductase